MSGGRNRFQDKVVIITGKLFTLFTQRNLRKKSLILTTGSSSGIGRAAAIEFAKEGAIVVLHGRSSEKLDVFL